MNCDPSSIMDLAGQLGGDHQQVARQMQGMGEVDPQQHSGLLNQFGDDPTATDKRRVPAARRRPTAAGVRRPPPTGGSQADQLPSLGRQGGQDDGSSMSMARASSYFDLKK